ncbi:MAG: thioesterase family protein [Actinomycetota bacterium]|nr:thioesterase family protein [Actinomycetota bacterium]
MDSDALFVPEGPETFRPTDFTRGPWSPDSLHGGPVVGLLARTVERAAAATGSALLCSRLTVEMLRPVPLDVLTTQAVVVKPGRRAAVVDGTLAHEGRVVARASSLWIVFDPAGAAITGSVPSRPPTPAEPRRAGTIDYPAPGFNCDTCDLRYVSGSHETSGPGVSWINLHSALVEGEQNSPFVAVATVSDLAAAAGWEETAEGGRYINPDITVQLLRLPQGPWIGLDARVVHAGNGMAMLDADLFDDHGPIGRVLQSLVEAPTGLGYAST